MDVDELKKLFKVNDDKDLAPIFNRKDRSVVSKWRKTGIPAGIEKKAKELLREKKFHFDEEYVSCTNEHREPYGEDILELIQIMTGLTGKWRAEVLKFAKEREILAKQEISEELANNMRKLKDEIEDRELGFSGKLQKPKKNPNDIAERNAQKNELLIFQSEKLEL